MLSVSMKSVKIINDVWTIEYIYAYTVTTEWILSDTYQTNAFYFKVAQAHWKQTFDKKSFVRF